MVTIGETRMWHDISSMAQSLARIAKAIEKVVAEEYEEQPATMWHDISSMAQSLARIAKAIEKVVAEEYEEQPATDDLPLTRVAWKSEVANGKTDQGFDDWLTGRRNV